MTVAGGQDPPRQSKLAVPSERSGVSTNEGRGNCLGLCVNLDAQRPTRVSLKGPTFKSVVRDSCAASSIESQREVTACGHVDDRMDA